MDQPHEPTSPVASPRWCVPVVVASALLGLALLADQALGMSATFDEVTYLRLGAHWWRTGDQAEFTRLGVALTSWKLQQAPTFWALDRLGLGAWVDDPIAHQVELLPIVRFGASWVWLLSMLLAANWARRLYGPRSMAMASLLFTLSPNLLAHGSLATLEMPLVASSLAMLLGFWSFLKSRRRRDFWATAALGGLAFSCKYTIILIPPILGLLWVVELWLSPEEVDRPGVRPGRLRRLAGIIETVGLRMIPFVAVMVASNLAVTGFSTLPMSPKTGHHLVLDGTSNPTLKRLAVQLVEGRWPSDWVGFAAQMRLQKGGGSSYLMGERRDTGWKHYYLVTLAVKVPLAFWFLAIGRAMMAGRSRREARDWFIPVFIAAFLLAAMLGSKRNFGYRYLLPIEAAAIVWISALAGGGRPWKWVAASGLAGMGLALGSIHPHELSYFNEPAGGPIGGRKVLSDSNLDWGQGAKSLARLQRDRPEFRDLTLFYFGDTDPSIYGVEGRRTVFPPRPDNPEGLPPSLTVGTEFLAVSASLQWGPWGKAGYFHALDEVAPVAYTDDWTIAIYRASDLREAVEGVRPGPVRTGRAPG